MIVPTVHLNGTSKEELLRQVGEAQRGVSVALKALSGMHPNARDYYTQGDTACRLAEAEHRLRVDALVDVRMELLKLYEAIEEQGR